MVHTIWTDFGDSLSSFWGEIFAIPFFYSTQGLGQGKGAVPPIWEVVITPVLEMIRPEKHRPHF